MKVKKIFFKILRDLSVYPKRVIFITSLMLILVPAVPVLNTGFSPFPRMVSEFISPVLLASPQVEKTISGTLGQGDTVSSLLNDYLPMKTIYALDRKSRDVFPLTRMRRGNSYKILLLEDKFLSFEYEINRDDRLLIRKNEDSFAVEKLPIEYDIKEQVISATIETSLAEGVKQQKEHPSLTWKLADIFAWDIDFIRDIQPGDKFKVLVEKRYKDGEFAGYADVLAAFFTNKGKEHKAFLFEDREGRKGYYDEKGQSLQKAFLRAPLNYSRISSGFSKRRFHPILKKYRPHAGVDYAAPRNTPIKAVADGTIKSISSSNSTGRQITIRHLNGYETSYFHMNKYAKGMKKNKKILQGDIIGYVGKTGLATGYHLCFRMKKNGKAVNPFEQNTTSAAPVSQDKIDIFLTRSIQHTETMAAHQKLARSDS